MAFDDDFVGVIDDGAIDDDVIDYDVIDVGRKKLQGHPPELRKSTKLLAYYYGIYWVYEKIER